MGACAHAAAAGVRRMLWCGSRDVEFADSARGGCARYRFGGVRAGEREGEGLGASGYPGCIIATTSVSKIGCLPSGYPRCTELGISLGGGTKYIMGRIEGRTALRLSGMLVVACM